MVNMAAGFPEGYQLGRYPDRICSALSDHAFSLINGCMAGARMSASPAAMGRLPTCRSLKLREVSTKLASAAWTASAAPGSASMLGSTMTGDDSSPRGSGTAARGAAGAASVVVVADGAAVSVAAGFASEASAAHPPRNRAPSSAPVTTAFDVFFTQIPFVGDLCSPDEPSGPV